MKKILVLFKKTPDTEAKIKISGDGKSLDQAGQKFIINPYDEFAIEEALQIKEKTYPSAEVVVVSLADESMRELFVKALGMGADRGVLIQNSGLENLDSLGIASILAKVAEAEKPDLILTGRHAIDDDNMHVTSMVAEILGWPHVNVASKIKIEGDTLHIERPVESAKLEVYTTKLPAVVGADKSLNQPRFVSLPGLMKAKKKPIDIKSPIDFGIDVASLLASVQVQNLNYRLPPEKPKGKLFKGEPVGEMVAKVVKLLREEAKVI